MGSTTFPIEPGWRPLLKDLGIRVDHLLRRAGLPADLFAREQIGIGSIEYFRLWRSLEAEADDPRLPFRIAEVIQTESFMPPIFAALCSANMAQAAARLAAYKRLIAPMRLDLNADRHGHLSLTPRWLEAESEVPDVLRVTELAFLLRLCRLGTREPVLARQVVLPNLPARTEMDAFAQYFGVLPRRGPLASLSLSASDVARPFLTQNDAMWRLFEPELRKRLSELDQSARVGERVQAALLELLPAGQASIDAVAERLLLSKRTLQRKLDAEGDNFRSLINRTREQLARHYLAKTRLSATEIGFLLGFADPNSFFRAFQDWTGQSPEKMRQAASVAND